MSLNWMTTQENSLPEATAGNDREFTVYRADVKSPDNQNVQRAIEATTEKACELLEGNIQDDSRYLLFGWNVDTATLTIVVTDDGKVRDSHAVVQCTFATEGQPLNTEDIQFWIKDFLSSYAPFLRYSLIAAFYCGSRNDCVLL
ncbi:hypothetical protein [Microbulbifer elongatus]|uniref:hypothetical protein n=1 Tax=Microbulbifer elongatus TaxID=86173 RepID=UPI001E37076E|nr:hypothetical protein [Microbulbifer elongatus]